MRRKNWWIAAGSLALASVLIVVFSPALIAGGVRGWLWWNARRERLSWKVEKIDAPFLRPVVIHGLRLTTAPDATMRATVQVNLATVSVNLRSILLRTRARAVRYAALEGVRVELHRNPAGRSLSESTWSSFEKLLPYSGRVDNLHLRVEDGAMVALLRGGSISFSDIEAGRFNINELTIASPFVRQTFSNLHGGTRWEGNALTLAGVALTRGLDLQSITFDLDHLNKERLGCEFEADLFGGKFRGEISGQWRGGSSNWTMAASASDVSLTQTAEALGVAGGVAGQLQALKFTYRGDLRESAHATASIWAQLTGPSWHDRKADVLMLGAVLYDRQIDIQQLYLKQANNQLTLNAHGQLPEHPADWLHPDLSGSVSAKIANLGDFAAFFGGVPKEFAGEVAIDGTIDTRGRKFTGQLSLGGKNVRVFGSPADLLEARVSMADNVVEIAKLNVKRGSDSLTGEGKIDMVKPDERSGHLDVFVKQLSDYLPQLGLHASVKANVDLAGNIARVEPLALTGSSPLSFQGRIDLSKRDDIIATFSAAAPIYVAPFTEDCVDRLEIVPLPNPIPPVPRLDSITLHGSATGSLTSLELATSVGPKTVRLNCTDAPNHVLQLAGEPPPKR